MLKVVQRELKVPQVLKESQDSKELKVLSQEVVDQQVQLGLKVLKALRVG